MLPLKVNFVRSLLLQLFIRLPFSQHLLIEHLFAQQMICAVCTRPLFCVVNCIMHVNVEHQWDLSAILFSYCNIHVLIVCQATTVQSRISEQPCYLPKLTTVQSRLRNIYILGLHLLQQTTFTSVLQQSYTFQSTNRFHCRSFHQRQILWQKIAMVCEASGQNTISQHNTNSELICNKTLSNVNFLQCKSRTKFCGAQNPLWTHHNTQSNIPNSFLENKSYGVSRISIHRQDKLCALF